MCHKFSLENFASRTKNKFKYKGSFTFNTSRFFFNLTLPGTVSGDIVKIAYLLKYNQEEKEKVILATFIDRVIGFLGLFIVATIVIVWSMSNTEALRNSNLIVRIFIYFVGVGSMCALLLTAVISMQKIILNYSIQI